MTEKDYTNALDFIQERLESAISDYALTKTEDLYDEKYDQILRAFFWSRGSREHILTLTAGGRIRAFHTKQFPLRLVRQISNELVAMTFDAMTIDD